MALDGTVAKRLQSELMTLLSPDAPKGISAFPDGENLLFWKGTIHAADGGYFEGMEFTLTLEFTSAYPMKAPVVKFETPIFHPNVDMSGNICLDILKEKWAATYTLSSLLLSIQQLLDNPNNDSPLNAQAAQLWDKKAEFAPLAKKRYATRKQ